MFSLGSAQALYVGTHEYLDEGMRKQMKRARAVYDLLRSPWLLVPFSPVPYLPLLCGLPKWGKILWGEIPKIVHNSGNNYLILKLPKNMWRFEFSLLRAKEFRVNCLLGTEYLRYIVQVTLERSQGIHVFVGFLDVLFDFSSWRLLMWYEAVFKGGQEKK